MKWLIADWGGKKDHIFQDVVGAIRDLGHTTESFSRSDMGQRPALIEVIRSGSFDALLTWQRFFPSLGSRL